MADKQLDIQIRATNLTGEAFAKVTGELRQLKVSTDQIAPASQTALGSFKSLAGGFIAGQLTVATLGRAFGELKDFVVGSVHEYAEQEAATKSLTTALKAQGSVFPLEAYKALSAQFQRTTVYGDELTQQMEAMLVEIGGVGPAQMKGALQAAMDLASGLGVDLPTATKLVGKAFAGETGTLTRYGIVIDQAKLKTEGASAVLGAIHEKFGGQAAAQAETYQGRVAQLGNAWGDFKKVVGEAIVQNPLLVGALERAKSGVDALNASVTTGTPAWATFSNLFLGETNTGILRWIGMVDDADRAIQQARTSALGAETPFQRTAAAMADGGQVSREAAKQVAAFRAEIETTAKREREAEAAAKAHTTAVQQLRAQLSGGALTGEVRTLADAYGQLTPAQRDDDVVMRRVADAAALLFDRGGLLDDRLLRLALTSDKLALKLGEVKHGLDELPGVTNNAVWATGDLIEQQQEMSQLVTGSAKDWVVYGGELLAVGDKYDILGAHSKDFSRHAIVDLRSVGSTMLTAINGSFAQMLLGAKGFKDGFLDIWRSIQAGFEQILAQMVQAFLTKFLKKILGLQESTSAAGIFGGGGFTLAGLFGGGASTAETVGPALLAPGAGVLAPGAGGGAAAGGLTAAGIGGGLAAGGAGIGLGLLGKSLFGGAGLGAGAFGGASGAASGALIGSIVPGIGTAVGAIIGGVAGFLTGIFGKSKGEKANDARDQILAQFGGQGTGAESGFGTLAAELTAATGEASGGHLFGALINAKDVNAVQAAWEAIVPVIEQYRQAQADAAKATEEATAAQQQEAAAAQQAADAHRAKVEAIQSSLGDLGKQLADLNASEAPEEVMGVVEAQTRARIAAEREVLEKKLDAANTEQARLDAQAKQLTEDLPAAAKEGVKRVNEYLQEVNPLHIVVDFPNPGKPAPTLHGGGVVLPHGGLRRFHEGGLASDEVLAILQSGEMVLPRSLAAGVGPRMAAARAVAPAPAAGADGPLVVILEADGLKLAEVTVPYLNRARKRLGAAG